MSTFSTRALLAALLVVMLGASEAFAQVSARLTGGVTRTSSQEPLFGAGIGGRLGWFEVDVEGGRMFNVLPDGILDELNQWQEDRDLPVRAIAKLRTTYVMGNVRLVSSAGPVQPFVTAGAGVARLEPRFDVVIQDIPLGNVFGLTSAGTFTEPLVSGGAGLRFDLDRVWVDVGYRYIGILTDFGLENGLRQGRTDVNSVYATLALAF